MFLINNVEYRVFHSDENGDILFPIHDACTDLVIHVLRNRYRSTPNLIPSITLETFYDSLCKQYARNMSAPGGNGYAMFGLEWEHNYYGARDMQGYNDWEGHHGDEVSHNIETYDTSLTFPITVVLRRSYQCTRSHEFCGKPSSSTQDQDPIPTKFGFFEAPNTWRRNIDCK